MISRKLHSRNATFLTTRMERCHFAIETDVLKHPKAEGIIRKRIRSQAAGMRRELKSPVETYRSSRCRFHKFGPLSILPHFGSFKSSLREALGEVRQQIDHWKFQILPNKVDSVLRAEGFENFVCELVGFDVHISRTPIQLAMWWNLVS